MSMKVKYYVLWLGRVLNGATCVEHIHQIVKGFSSDWKKALDLINQDIMRTFTNFKNGTAILQVLHLSIIMQRRNDTFM